MRAGARAAVLRHRLSTAVLVALLCGFAGCSSLDIRKNIPWGEGKDEKPGEPTKVVVMWTDAMLNQSEKKGVRGFGGRLYFYGKDPNKPIKVKGGLVIYAFDEAGRDPDNVVPDKKYVFTSEQMEKHYSKNEVGASYSVWLPWDQVGGVKKEVSLIARFTSDKGGLVISEQTKQELPGMPAPTAADAKGKNKGPGAPDLAAEFAKIQAAVKQTAGASGGAGDAAASATGGINNGGTNGGSAGNMSSSGVIQAAALAPVGGTTGGVVQAGAISPVAGAAESNQAASPTHNTTTILLPANGINVAGEMQANAIANRLAALNSAGMHQMQLNGGIPNSAGLPGMQQGFSQGMNAMPGGQPNAPGAFSTPGLNMQVPGVGMPAGAMPSGIQGLQPPANGAGPMQTTTGVLPGNSWSGSPGWNTVPPFARGTLPNASGPGTAVTGLNGPRAATTAGAPIGWNPNAPWSAGFNKTGAVDPAGAGNATGAAPLVTTTTGVLPTGTTAGPNAAAWGANNGTTFTGTNSSRSSPASGAPSPASF